MTRVGAAPALSWTLVSVRVAETSLAALEVSEVRVTCLVHATRAQTRAHVGWTVGRVAETVDLAPV